MPAKNSLKTYTDDSYYHIYNRGVEKRLIFLDKQDYAVFLSYLKDYLLPKDEAELQRRLLDPLTSYKERDKILKLLRLNNFADEIILIAYCLMPNHFHFLLKQRGSQSIDKFMNSFGVRYAMYFNRKYKRVGAFFQDAYKAVLVESEPQLLYLSKYIHRNPLKNTSKSTLQVQEDLRHALYTQPSSYPDYLRQRRTEWIHPEYILGYFSQVNPQMDYKAFVEQQESDDDILPISLAVIDIDL